MVLLSRQMRNPLQIRYIGYNIRALSRAVHYTWWHCSFATQTITKTINTCSFFMD